MKSWINILCAVGLILLSQVAVAQTYRIGVLVPLTGSKADKGIPLKRASCKTLRQAKRD